MPLRTGFPTLTCSVLLLLVLSSPLLADKLIVEEVTLSEGGKTIEIQTWLGTKRLARIDPVAGLTTIVRADLGKIYLVRHAEKEVIEADLPLTLPESYGKLFSEVRMRWQLSWLSETRKIDIWDCRKVVIRGRGTIAVDIEMWVTKGAPLDGLAGPLAELDGAFAVETDATINKLGVRSRAVSRVKSVSSRPPNPRAYTPPDDFTRTPLDFKAYLYLVRTRYSPFIQQ